MPRQFLAAVFLAATAAAALAACQRPSAEQCEQICWRCNELSYWERFASEARELTPDARERLRAERVKTWKEMRARAFDPGLENCIRSCRRSANPDDVECVQRAATSAQAAACLK